MTTYQIHYAALRKLAAMDPDHPAVHMVATTLGIIPRKSSEDAGQPFDEAEYMRRVDEAAKATIEDSIAQSQRIRENISDQMKAIAKDIRRI